MWTQVDFEKNCEKEKTVWNKMKFEIFLTLAFCWTLCNANEIIDYEDLGGGDMIQVKQKPW